MALEGDLRSTALPRVLQHLAHQHETGILTVQGENDIVAVSLLNGQIVAADALNQTVEDGLGQVLVDQGLISAADFSAVAGEHQGGSSGSLGDLLVARQHLTREQLLSALRVQTYRLMLQVLGWERGEYKFYGGDEVSYEEGFLPIPIEELIIRALHDTRKPLPDPRVVYARGEPSPPIRVLGREGDGSEPGIWLTQGEIAFLEKVDGVKTNAAIAQACGLGKYRALHCLYRLWQEGLITPVGGAVSPETPTSVSAPTSTTAPTMATTTISTGAAAPPLQAQIFAPPDPGSQRGSMLGRGYDAVLEDPSEIQVLDGSELRAPAVGFGPLLAALVVVALAVLVWLQPTRLLLPFPWQAPQRATFERLLYQSTLQRIDRSARTWFLLEADYPDSLEELVAADLLASSDLDDPSGRRLRYTKGVLSYRLVPLDKGDAVEELAREESINDDFLLDLEFLPDASGGAPALYLID